MVLNFFSVQFPCAFAPHQLPLSFFRFQGFVHALDDAVLLPVIACLDVTVLVAVVNIALVFAVVVVVAVVIIIFLAGDEVQFLHAPALFLPAIAVVALFFS